MRPVERHDDGLPVAQDLQDVHRVLEESFQDHFSSYRESFPEFVMRLREDPGHRWDHWWLATVETDEGVFPAGALVSTVLREDAAGFEGSYVDYIGVHRRARGRGVAKALVAHRDRGCRAARAQPGGPRGRRRLTDRGRRPLHLDGLGHRLPHPVLAPRARPALTRARRCAGVGSARVDVDHEPGRVASARTTLNGRWRSRTPDEGLADGLEAAVDRQGLRDDGAGERGGGGVARSRRVRRRDADRADHHLEVGVARARRRRHRCRRRGLVDVMHLERRAARCPGTARPPGRSRCAGRPAPRRSRRGRHRGSGSRVSWPRRA